MADLDEQIRKALEEDDAYKSIMTQLLEAASSTKKFRADEPCDKPGCGCKHIRYFEAPNYDLKLKIADWLYERGVGRPNQADNAGEEKITFIREVRK